MRRAIEEWDDTAPNREQQYLTHGAFRYFGKLPPTVTGRILDELDIRRGKSVVDVMCGSGTTLVESSLRGAEATGVDCNDVSALVCRVKTTPLPLDQTRRLFADYDASFERLLGRRYLDEVAPSSLPAAPASPSRPAPSIRNFERWFTPDGARVLCVLRDWIDRREGGPTTDLARVAFVSAIRSCSRASIRTGRLFRDTDKRIPNPVAEVRRRMQKIAEAVASLSGEPRWRADAVSIMVGDARATGLPGGKADLVFCHPPYFALYRYSSDVLRFEMDWLGVDRKAVGSREIEDGFKTTDETLVEEHVRDLVAVAREGHRLAAPGGHLVFVTADSTLRKQRLAILEPLIAGTTREGWRLVRRARRKVRFAQASYHRSADAAIQRPDDEILMFERR